MLAREQRLAQRKDFEKIFKQGQSCYTKFYGIKILPGQLAGNRFGIIISAKISKKSVERNRLKRQIRQALRELDQGIRPAHDVVIIVLPGLLGQSYQIIKAELEKIFARLKILKHV